MTAQMSPKERVKTSFAHQEPDRAPVNYHVLNPELDLRLKKHFGLARDDTEGLRQAIGVDFRRIETTYIGQQLHKVPPERRVSVWGARTRWIKHGSGGYWDICDFPLRNAALEQIEAWPMPSPDDFDYSRVP